MAGAADTGATRAVGETAESAVREPGERAAREAVESGERARGGRRPTTGEGALRAADEPGVPTIRDDALKAAQMLEARVSARAIAEANDAVDAPVPVVIGAYAGQARYRWIEAFYARPRGPATSASCSRRRPTRGSTRTTPPASRSPRRDSRTSCPA